MTSPDARRPLADTRARRARTVALVCAVALLAAGCSGGGADGGQGDGDEPSEATVAPPPEPELGDRDEPLPVVTPTPVDMRWLGADATVPDTVTVEAAEGTDRPALDALTAALEDAGARTVTVTAPGAAETGDGRLVVRVGSAADEDVRAGLDAVGVQVPADPPAEGYALAVHGQTDGSSRVVVAGNDDVGTFYAVQTLRQLAGDGRIAGVGVVDHPAMGLRGTVEGFYGSPWTTEERLDQLTFHGRYKLNTYIYAPKDDPYHRDRWREPYPAGELDGVRRLVEAAAANHVRFTFAVSPGVSICYSDPADVDALVAKLEAMRSLGVRAFSIALDDIDIGRWNCTGDGDTYGAPGGANAARAQVELLNTVKETFVDAHPEVRPLQTVPTDYRGTGDDPYRVALREGLAPAIEVMWTGAYVVPDEITVEQARAAADTYGRSLFVWDNTPVNDFPPTEGRLILAPYARRQPGLSNHVTGIALNPMNQAAASKVQLVGAADFTWNDGAYDAARAHRAAAADLAGGDLEVAEALLTFFDLENLAPTSALSGIVSQPQAPALAAELDTFRATWSGGDRAGAVDALRPVAERIAAAPERIRGGVVDPAFVADCAPWLDATALWGRAFVRTLDGLAARVAGDETAAAGAFADADRLSGEAAAIRTIPGETRPEGPVRVGDGVLDSFLAEADGLG
jgi:hyaluronoglucosaminidase